MIEVVPIVNVFWETPCCKLNEFLVEAHWDHISLFLTSTSLREGIFLTILKLEMQPSLHLRDDGDQLFATITCFPSFGEGYSSGEPDPAVSASRCAGELLLQAFLWSMNTQLVALMEDYRLTANRSKARAPMLAHQSKAFQILARSCFQLSRSPQLALYSFTYVPHQVPGSPSELFTETDTHDGFYSVYL